MALVIPHPIHSTSNNSLDKHITRPVPSNESAGRNHNIKGKRSKAKSQIQ